MPLTVGKALGYSRYKHMSIGVHLNSSVVDYIISQYKTVAMSDVFNLKL